MSNKPSIPKGTRDFSPIEMARRNYIFDTIKKVYKKYGFQQIETPAMENLETLIGTGGDESDKLIFKILDSGDFLKKPRDKKLFQDNSIAYFNLHIYYSLKIFFKELINSPNDLQGNLDLVAKAIDEQSGFHMYQEIDLLAITTEFFFTNYNYFKKEAIKIGDRDNSFDFYFDQFYRAHFLQNGLYLNFINSVAKAVDSDKELISTLESNQLSSLIVEKALHYDLTVPFARYVVQNQNDITFPFRRFQIQPVWRADRPQKGRYREFYQCDADIIGSDSLLNEVDLIKIIDDVFTELFQGKLNYTVSVNNRKILQGIAEINGVLDRLEEMTVIIDKIDKIGIDGVQKELEKNNFPADIVSPIFSTLEYEFKSAISQIKYLFTSSVQGQKGIEELEFIFEKLQQLGLKTANVKFDPTLARGLGYYTGTIIEVKVDNFPSICGGGRYDDLTGKFGLKDVSGVGISFGADRIYDVLLDNNLYPEFEGDSTQVLFVNFGEKEQDYCLPLLFQLRDAAINAEIYPDAGAKMKKQMKFANDKNINYVVLVGSDEMASGKLTVKNMKTGEQHAFTIEELIQALKK